MKKCDKCSYIGTQWLLSNVLEVMCPNCKQIIAKRFVEDFHGRGLSYQEAIRIYDRYERDFIHHSPDIVTSWAELDVALNESVSRVIRGNNVAKDKLE